MQQKPEAGEHSWGIPVPDHAEELEHAVENDDVPEHGPQQHRDDPHGPMGRAGHLFRPVTGIARAIHPRSCRSCRLSLRRRKLDNFRHGLTLSRFPVSMKLAGIRAWVRVCQCPNRAPGAIRGASPANVDSAACSRPPLPTNALSRRPRACWFHIRLSQVMRRAGRRLRSPL
jgi:hypothetical protein